MLSRGRVGAAEQEQGAGPAAPGFDGQVISMVSNALATKTRDTTVAKVLEAIRTGGTRLKGQITADPESV